MPRIIRDLKSKLKSASRVKLGYMLGRMKYKITKSDRLPYTPWYLHIEPTNYCNFMCVTCSRRTLKRRGHLTLEKFKLILDQFPYLITVKIQGMGESLMNPEYISMLKYAKSKNIKTTAIHNGTLINEKNVDDLVKNLDFTVFSIDGATPETFKKIRGVPHFTDVIKNIRLFVERRNALHPDMGMSVNMVCTKDNYLEIPLVVKLVHELGIDHITVHLMADWSADDQTFNDVREAYKQNSISEFQTFFDKVAEAKQIGNKLGLDVHHAPEPSFKAKWSDCPKPWENTYITWDGYVTPCCNRPNPDQFNFGNVFDTPFRKIWNSDKYIAFRKMLKRNICPDICRNCSLETYTKQMEAYRQCRNL